MPAERHPRTARVAVMLTENERRHLDRLARREMLSISTWLRKVVVAELVRQNEEQNGQSA